MDFSTLVDRPAQRAAVYEALLGPSRGAHIVGQRGSGKTTLAQVIADQMVDVFRGGVAYVAANPMMTLESAFSRHFSPRLLERSLLIIDDADFLLPRASNDIAFLQKQEQRLSFLLISTGITDIGRDLPIIRLGPLSMGQIEDLMRKRFHYQNQQFSREISKLSGGDLWKLIAILTLISSTKEGAQKVLTWLQNFERVGILGPDGEPIARDQLIRSPIVTDVISANERLVTMVRVDPQLMHKLSSREFEELVAELLYKQGYDVELTPPSNDGGFDIRAARKDGVGEFLYLVECKRYSPTHPVGVSIVRSLHGVVQQQQATAGVVVTSSVFTRGAKEFQQSVPHTLSLRDYVELQRWLENTQARHSRA
jgi:restriction system protein